MIFAFSRDGGLPAGSKALSQGQPEVPHARGRDLDGFDRSRFSSSGSPPVRHDGRRHRSYSIVVSCTVIFLFFSFAIPIALGLFAYGTKKWPTMGPWNVGRGLFKLFAILSIVAMVLIFFIGIQPPNDWALWITIGFLAAGGHHLVRLREPPLPGSADRRRDREAQGRDRGRREGRGRNRLNPVDQEPSRRWPGRLPDERPSRADPSEPWVRPRAERQ